MTSTTTSGTGRQVVTIAAPRSNARVSHNTYHEFGVGIAGATFDNSVGARLIVNEVTGTSASRILGEIAIDGARANFVLANPNGISVNGARFVNVGSVSLATGKASLIEYQTGVGITQIDPLIEVRGGSIEVGPQGLVGAFNNLDLIAKNLRISGHVNNTYTSPNARTKVVVGDVNVQYDSAISAVDDQSQWGYFSQPRGAAAASSRVAVDITGLGSLTSGRIDVIVTDKGAGVRHAGAVRATAGDFTVLADGLIEIRGGAANASGVTVLQGDRIIIGAGESGTQSSLVGDNSIRLIATDVAIQGASVDSKFGILDVTATEVVSLIGVSMQGGAGVRLKGKSLTTSSDDTNKDAVAFTSIRSNGGSVNANFAGGMSLLDTEVLARSNVLLETDGSLEIVSSRGSSFQSKLVALDGGMVARIGGDWFSSGALIQGGSKLLEDALSKPSSERHTSLGDHAVLLDVGGSFHHKSVSREQLGIIFGEAGSVSLRVGGDAHNMSARIISNRSLSLEVGGAFANEALKEGPGAGESHSSSTTSAYGFLRRRSESRSVDHGSLLLPGELGYLVADGDISIKARSVLNRGGEINANNGSIDIQARDAFFNEALRVGQAELTRRCLIFCRSSVSGGVSVIGGAINASRDVRIQAGTTLDNIGGSVIALEHIRLQAPHVRATSLEAIAALGLFRGLAHKAGSNWATLHAYDVGGVFRSAKSSISVEGNVELDGGDLIAMDGVTISGRKDVVRPPRVSDFRSPSLGVLFRRGG
ncbi:MAG: filamentous hemagglutinin N-terminal domain-containing protein [Betaproteobacteria bacterium]|nr:filamentous hemagglutinin N-terminal domain-containing protein [Betaproteobacteria bacterium]